MTLSGRRNGEYDTILSPKPDCGLGSVANVDVSDCEDIIKSPDVSGSEGGNQMHRLLGRRVKV